MSILRKSKTAQLVAALAGFAMVFSLVFAGTAIVAPKAEAQTDANQLIQALLSNPALLDQVLALLGSQQTTTVSSSYTFTRDLTEGSTGADVMELQKFLNRAGFKVAITGAGSPGMESSFFGPATKAALAAYQAANGISPAAGYFGPITRAKINSSSSIAVDVCVNIEGVQTVVPAGLTRNSSGNCVTGTTTTGPIVGGAGNIQSTELMSAFSGEEVGEGERGIEVIGVEVEADEGSDLSLQNVRVEFSYAGTSTGSNRFDRYAESVDVLLDGQVVGSADARDFSRSSAGIYNRTISVSDAVIRAGETSELTIAISSVSNLDSNDEGEDWDVEILSVRYTDGAGAVLTENLSNKERNFTFESLATASNLKLRITTASGNPASRTEKIDSTSRTDGIVLFRTNLRADGSDLWIDELPVFIETGSADVGKVVARVRLTLGSRTYNENIPSGATSTTTVVFDDLDFTLDKGDSVVAVITVDVKGLTGNYSSGETIKASIGADERNAAIIEDMNGDNLGTSQKTGTITGNQVTLREEGINVTLLSADDSVESTGGDNPTVYGKYTFRFRVSADDDDLYIDSDKQLTDTPSVAGGGLAWASTTHSGTPGTTTVAFTAASNSQNTTSNDPAGRFRVAAGTSRDFTLTVTIEANTTFSNDVMITGINYSTDSADTDPNEYYTDLDGFEVTGVTVVK